MVERDGPRRYFIIYANSSSPIVIVMPRGPVTLCIFYCDGGLLYVFGVADGHEIVGGYGGEVVYVEDVGLLNSHGQLLVDFSDEGGEVREGISVHVGEEFSTLGDEFVYGVEKTVAGRRSDVGR